MEVFQALNAAFGKAFDKLSGRGKLREADVAAAAREIKLALLAADVHFSVVRDFVDGVALKAAGREVLDSITPLQQFTKIVHDELVRVLGGASAPFDFACRPPMIVLVVGLQGSGKTTAAARFAKLCREAGRKPILVSVDVRRPAAIDQLRILAEKARVDFWPAEPGDRPAKIAKAAVHHAERNGYDTVIVDTAGRLHIDAEMMDEVRDVAKKIEPQRILYIADSMTGQDAVRSAKAFDEALPITGIVLTKLDGDARGGAALSVRAVTGKPIVYAGMGEGLDDLEPFYPDRMAGRILGRGDIVSLVEKVAARVEEAEAREIGERMMKESISFDDFLKQLKMMKRMGPLEKMIGLMPGMGNIMEGQNPAEMEAMLYRREAMILSMTRQERNNPRILNGSRRRRIAAGAGVSVPDLNRFIKEFEMFRQMMKRAQQGGLKGLFKGLTSQVFS